MSVYISHYLFPPFIKSAPPLTLVIWNNVLVLKKHSYIIKMVLILTIGYSAFPSVVLVLELWFGVEHPEAGVNT